MYFIFCFFYPVKTSNQQIGVRLIARSVCLQQNVDDNIQLGPGGRSGYGGWVHGSSGGGKTSSQEGERPSTPSNRSVKLCHKVVFLKLAGAFMSILPIFYKNNNCIISL